MVNLSWNHPTGNFWMDTGLVVLLQQFGEGEHSVEGVLEWLRRQLLQPSGNRGSTTTKLVDRSTSTIK
jgi:hypothetical protein